jgi:DNA polymerase I
MKSVKKIYIVDTSSMFFRAFYAVRPLSSLSGVPVNAVYGFVSMIMKLLKEKNPEYIVFCYDRKEPSFRKDLDQNYKANRSEMPDELQQQMPYIKQVAGLFGIADIEVPGYEADDLIGTVARLAERENLESYIVSGDKDFCQIVSDKVFIYDTMKETLTTPQTVKEKYGVSTEQFIDYLAITGDNSDNIPGVKGIGPKGAQSLIEQFGSLKNIYENLDSVKSETTKEKLRSAKENAFLSQKLVTIVTDIDLKRDFESFKRGPVKADELRAFFKELNFKTFEKTFFSNPGNIEGGAQEQLLTNEANFPDLTTTINGPPLVGHLAVERSDWNSELIQSKMTHEPFFVFLKQSEFCIGFFENGKSSFFSTNIADTKLNFKNLKWNGFDLKRIWTEIGLPVKDLDKTTIESDLMLECYILSSKDCSDYSKCIKSLLKKEISEETTAVDIFTVLLELRQYAQAQIADKNLTSILQNCDIPIIKILYKMERKGIKLDLENLKKYSEELAIDIVKLESEIQTLAGEEFNVASPKQLGVILFEKMGLPSAKKTKTGYSTDSDVLESLNHPIGKKLIDFREFSKLKSTYVDSLPELVDQDHRLHSNFQQAVTATGRFSSINPNLQNIPIRTERGKKVRTAFIPDHEKKLLSVDYSQIELRVLADIADDPGLIEAFKNDLDIHAATASEVFSVSLKDVTSDQRRIAKAVNFGIAYGQGAFGLAETLGISRSESKEIIEKYFKKFSGIKDYISNTIESAHKNKYVETRFGRRRYIAELDSSNMMLKKFGERAAINAPIQGTASDLVKMAMIDVDRTSKLDLLIQVHDELVFEGTAADIEQELPKIKFAMENVARLKVPLKVNAAVGKNWDQAH